MPQAAMTESVSLRARLGTPALPISVAVITCLDRVRVLLAAPFVIRDPALTSDEVATSPVRTPHQHSAVQGAAVASPDTGSRRAGQRACPSRMLPEPRALELLGF